MKISNNILNNNKGFSLVEMAIALVVLAVIAGVVYLAAQPYVERSSYTAAGQQLESIRGAITSFYGDNKSHPCKQAAGTYCNGAAAAQWAQLTPAYLPNVPPATWRVACSNGASLDIITDAADQKVKVAQQFQQQCATVITSASSSDTNVTCRLSTTPKCP